MKRSLITRIGVFLGVRTKCCGAPFIRYGSKGYDNEFCSNCGKRQP